jgi:hypothetical protein
MHKRRGGGGIGQPVGSQSSVTPLASPSITFNNIVKNYGDTSFALSPVSTSDGTFTYTSSDTNVATIAGSTVTIHNAGTTTITAIQSQSGDFAGTQTTATLTVDTIAPSIIPLISIIKTQGDPPFILGDPTSNSAGAFTFTSTNPAVATIVGRTVTLHAAGSATIISTQAANGNYKSGSGTTTLTVNPLLEES